MNDASATPEAVLANGHAAAAILASGIGVASLGILALAADAEPVLNQSLAFYRPSGALSGVTTVAIAIWLASWAGLTLRWRGSTIAMVKTSVTAFLLMAVGILLTFPPLMDALQAK